MASLNSDEEAQAHVYEWAMFSDYSPFNLQHLPQPMPSEMRQLVSEGVPAEESHFTFRDAFEDLLLHARHPDNGSWPKAPRDYNYVVNAPTRRQLHVLDVVDWTNLVGTLGYWGHYFSHLPPKPLRWTGLQYDEPLMHAIEDMVRRRFRPTGRAVDLTFIPNTPKYRGQLGQEALGYLEPLDEDGVVRLLIELPGIHYETMELDRELHGVSSVYEGDPMVEEDFYLRAHSAPVAEARLPNLSSEVKDTWHGHFDKGRRTADGGSVYTLRHIQETREDYSIREFHIFVASNGQIHGHEETMRIVRSISPNFWGKVWQHGQAKMAEPETYVEPLAHAKPGWIKPEVEPENHNDADIDITSYPSGMTTNPTESGPRSNSSR